MNQYVSYDIELFEQMEDGNNDLSKLIPSTAALCTNYEDITYYDNDPHMTKETANKLVDTMLEWHRKEYKVLTWNGLSFDLQLLGLYADRIEDCGRIALNHYDMMFLVVAHKGFFLGLDKALVGANIQGKLHDVVLNDNSTFSQMEGSKAPMLWKNKEFSAVREYLRVDVESPLKLAYYIEKEKQIKWTSNAGKINRCFTDMLTVKECLKLPLPDTSWQKS